MKQGSSRKATILTQHPSDNELYVYIDWTTEQAPRPFYVGKGDALRVKHKGRNKKHQSVSKKHGFNRTTVYTSHDEGDAFACEVRMIAEYHTYIGDPLASSIACNFTTGGEGVKGINKRSVHQHKDGLLVATHKSIKEVASKFGVTSAVLSNAFKGVGVFPMNMREFTWEIAPSRRRETKSQHGNSIIVVELDPVTHEVRNEFHSITEALVAAKVSYTTFSRIIRSQDARRMQNLVKKTGSSWAFKDVKCLVSKRRVASSSSGTRSKPVMVKNKSGTEWTFTSVTAAANFMQIDVNKVLSALHHHEGELGEFVWSFINDTDKHRNIVRSEDWLSAIQGVNGISVIKLDEAGTIVARYRSFAEAENIEGYMRRELYSTLSAGKTFSSNGFTWKVEDNG